MEHLFFYNKLNKKFLDRFLSSQNPPAQSLLFWGEPGLGKTTIALSFAQGLLCQEKKWGGCGQCRSCQLFLKNIHPDFFLIKPPAKEFSTISIKDIRGDPENQEEGVIQFLSYKPQMSSYRIVVIDEAEKMTTEAQNAFLKTLEEPNQNSLIILVSHFPQKLLPTIRSRVISLRFTRASVRAIQKYLQKEYSLNEKQAILIAQESEGKIAEAVKLLDKEYSENIKKQKLLLKKLLSSDFLKQTKLLEDLFKKDNRELSKINNILTIWLKELRREKNYSLAKKILQAYEMINRYNINRRLLLENIFIEHHNNIKYQIANSK